MGAAAQEPFKFSIGDQVQILSDKAYRKTKSNKFEAVGNVIITHTNKALYGEKASFSMDTGEVDVIGNVRYVGPKLTLYGTSLEYNFKTKFLEINNARITSDNYIVIGKKITRVSDSIITAKDAEYTTCKDCPESWSISGQDIRITIGEYVSIKHAFLKVKGVIIMYFPYIIFPIKKNRETGLLFPKFGMSKEGARIQQPWFWAISKSQDMTLTPSIYGKRGVGNEFQYRQVLGDAKWFEFNSLQARDRIYTPNKVTDEVSGQHFGRHFSDYEHNFSAGHFFNHHVYYNDTSDLDIVRDFSLFTDKRVRASDLGASGFFELRQPAFSLHFESFFRKNQLVDDTRKFDHQYVQILPKIGLSLAPVTLFSSNYFFLKNLTFGADGDFTVFKQNHLSENQFIRNAQRINIAPYVNWRLGELGPFNLKTQAKLDQQNYRFPYEKEERKFSKRGLVYESEVSFEIEKIFGLAYEEKVPVDKVDFSLQKMSNEKIAEKDGNYIGSLPSFDNRFTKDTITISKNSYRHSQIVKLKHFYLTAERISGSEKFKQQIDNDLNGELGLFDHRDAKKSQVHELVDISTSTSIPIKNTFEFQWNHSIIRKKPNQYDAFEDGRFLREQFSYDKIAYFNVSQGYYLNAEAQPGKNKRLKDSLTRLNVSTGLSINNFSISASEYYFYLTDKHIFSLNIIKEFARGKIGTRFNYKALTVPVDKTIGVNGTYKINDLIELSAAYDYDIEQKQGTNSEYAIVYSPVNNCWKLGLNYFRSLIEKDDKRVTLNLFINFNDNNFKSLSGE